MKTAEDILKDAGTGFIAVSPETTVHEAVKILDENKIGALLIWKNNKIIGIWTEQDLLHALVDSGFDPVTVAIKDCMTAGFGFVSHTASIYNLLDMFRASNLRHLIVTKDGNSLGLISTEDVYKAGIIETSKDYKSLFEHVGCGVYISSKEGKFLDVNHAFMDMMGYKNKMELLEVDIAEEVYQNPDERKKFQKMIERDGQLIDYEVNFKRKDGSIIPILLTAHVRYDQSGNVLGYEGIAVDQSLKKQIEDDYKRLFENVGCGVYVSSKDGKFRNANQALMDMLGHDNKEEFLKIDLEKDLYFDPGDRRKFQEKIEREGKVINYEVDFKHRNGKPVPVLLTAHVRYGPQGEVLGYEGVNIDQTQKKQMERELREAHDFLNEIIHSSPNAITATDLEGNIIIWNRTAEETLGYTAEEVLGEMKIDKIYSEGMAKRVMQMVRSKEYGGVGLLRAYPMVYVRQDGGIVEGNISAALIYDSNGKEVAYVGIFVDLEDRLRMERELRQTQEQLLQSEKLAAMGRLTSQIAHELNNPLYGIMNTLELMKTEIPPENRSGACQESCHLRRVSRELSPGP